MLRTGLILAAALTVFGATSAYAGGDGRHHGDHHGPRHGWDYPRGPNVDGPAPHARPYGHHHGRYAGRGWGRNGPAWFDYRGRPYCRVEPRKVRIKVWDRRGNPYRKWVWKDVRVCS